MEEQVTVEQRNPGFMSTLGFSCTIHGDMGGHLGVSSRSRTESENYMTSTEPAPHGESSDS